MSEHRRALDAVTGIPASAGFCEPVEGYADSPMSITATVKAMAYEVGRLNKQLAAAKEENERVRQANLHTMDVFEDMKAAKEKAEARVAEHEEEMELFTAVAVMICQQESDEWGSDRLQTHKDYAEVCGQRIAKLTPVNARAWLLRKQAEAVEHCGNEFRHHGVLNYAQRLRQQANEAERAGGES